MRVYTVLTCSLQRCNNIRIPKSTGVSPCGGNRHFAHIFGLSCHPVSLCECVGGISGCSGHASSDLIVTLYIVCPVKRSKLDNMTLRKYDLRVSRVCMLHQ